jgi:hypothetical protein
MRHGSHLVRPASVVLAMLVTAAAASTAAAQNVFDDFSSGNDAAWSRLDGPGLFGLGTSNYSVANGGYTLRTPSIPNVGLAVPTSSVRADGAAVDSQISVDVTGFSGVPVISLVARGFQSPSGGYNYYNLVFFPISRATGPSGEELSNFRIDRWNANPAVPGTSTITNLTSFNGNAFPAVKATNTFRLIFTLEGSRISGSLFDLTDAPTEALVDFSITDDGPGALLGPGVPGVSVVFNTPSDPIATFPSVSATFDNFRVVPSPGAAALLALGGVVTARRRRA